MMRLAGSMRKHSHYPSFPRSTRMPRCQKSKKRRSSHSLGTQKKTRSTTRYQGVNMSHFPALWSML